MRLLLVWAVWASLAGAGLAAGPEETPSALVPPAPPARVLIVGMTVAPPFIQKDSQGQLGGISYDLWRDVAQDLGFRWKAVEYDLPGLLAALRDGRVDVGVSDLSITPGREAVMLCSRFLSGKLSESAGLFKKIELAYEKSLHVRHRPDAGLDRPLARGTARSGHPRPSPAPDLCRLGQTVVRACGKAVARPRLGGRRPAASASSPEGHVSTDGARIRGGRGDAPPGCSLQGERTCLEQTPEWRVCGAAPPETAGALPQYRPIWRIARGTSDNWPRMRRQRPARR